MKNDDKGYNSKYELRMNFILGCYYDIKITGKALGKLTLCHNNTVYDLGGNSFEIKENILITKRMRILVASLAIFEICVEINDSISYNFTNDSPSDSLDDFFCFINTNKIKLIYLENTILFLVEPCKITKI